MKNLNTYESWLITEKNKAVEYFREHPEELSKYASGIQPHYKHDFKPAQAISGHNDPEWPAREKIMKVARLKLMKSGSDTGEFEVGRAKWKWTDLFVGQLEGWSGWYDVDYFRKSIIENKTFDDFLEAAEGRSRLFRYPFEDYGKRVEPQDEPLLSLYTWMRKHYSEIQDWCKWIEKALDGIRSLGAKKAEKEFMKLGLSTNDVQVAMTYVKEWTSMSRKKLDPSVWPLLQKISVDDSLLPQYLYRGIFYDGAKIKDPVKWKEKWYPGAKPGASQGKATSWTVDRGTAAEFMTDQDFIKDRENGYYMLLKWKVDPKLVIADLRNLPVDHTFWNQQEIIVSPEARDYEVDTMIPGSEGYDGWRAFVKSNKGGQGAYGQTKADFALGFMNTPYETLDPGMRMEFKQVTKMTVGEFRKAYPNTRINADTQWNDLAMPIYNLATRWLTRINFIKSSRNELVFTVSYDLRDLDYSSNPNIRSVYKKYYDEMKFNQFSGTKVIESNEGSIKLIDDDYYDMDIEVKIPTEFSLKDKLKDGKALVPDKLDVDANLAMEKIFNEIGSDEFVNAAKASQQEVQSKVPKNINISIK